MQLLRFRSGLALTVAGTVLTAGLAVLTGCGGPAEKAAPVVQSAEALTAQSDEFRQSIEEVTAGVWIAIGYGLANSILVEGDDGLIVIDTMATLEEGRSVATLFRELSPKPLRAIIYTHNHADHVFGAQAYVDVLGDPQVPVEVIAHQSTAGYVHRIVSEYRPIITARSFRMFGTELSDEELGPIGIGGRLDIKPDSTFGFVVPTQVFDDKRALTIAGIELELVHAPGETDDQIFVWMPQSGVLAVGDNLYKAFPNLYTIRGTPYRSLKGWAASIDKMRALPVQHLAPGHTWPLHGAVEIQRVLTNYRDAIRFVYDQSVRAMNAGLGPEEIAAMLRLPPHLAKEPYLAEFYGTLRWSARAVFAGNLGWFDGNPANLDPLPPTDFATRIAELAGGTTALHQAMSEALASGEYQWGLQISDWLLRAAPDNPELRAARAKALRKLGEAATNPNARHYYLMSAKEIAEGLRLRPINTGTPEMTRAIPMPTIMDALATSLRAEDVLDREEKVQVHFTDTDETWTLWLRRGVLETVPRAVGDPDIAIDVDSLIWKQMLGRIINPAVAIARHIEFRKGNALAFSRFMLLFKPARDAPEPAPLAAVDQ